MTSHGGLNSYDQENSLLNIRKEETARDSTYVALHETTHWFQHYGTAFGAFNSDIRILRDEFTINALRALSEDRLRRILSGRLKNPIIKFNSQIIPNLKDDWSVGRTPFKETWYQFFVCERTMTNYSHLPGTMGHPGYSMGHSIFLVQNHLSGSYPDCYRSQTDSASYYALIDALQRGFAPVTLNVGDDQLLPLDTADICETAAMLVESAHILATHDVGYPANLEQDDISPELKYKSELANDQVRRDAIFLMNRNDSRISIMTPTQCLRELAVFGRFGLTRDPYNLALHVAAKILADDASKIFNVFHPKATEWGMHRPFVTRNFWALIAAIEVALEPPLPPRHNTDLRELDWLQVYPPARFVACLRAISKLGAIDDLDALDRRVYYRYVTEVASAANLRFHSRPTAKIADSLRSNMRLLDPYRLLGTDRPRGINYKHWVKYIQTSTMDIQQKANLSFYDLVNRARNGKIPITRDFKKVASSLLENFRIGPPVFMYSNDKTRSVEPGASMSSIAAADILESAADNYSIYELVTSTGTPNFDQFSSIGRSEEWFAARASRQLEAEIGVRPW